MSKLRVLSLFAGIGGFDRGLEMTGGFETIAFCEREEFPRRVLAKHWPEIQCFPDVRTLKGSDIGGPVDVICGGYPCQPFSTAGKRQGKEDDRHLWPEFSRLVDELRPTWVIGENVAGHISMGLDDVLADLEAKGYACRTFVIPACAVGASHRRDRVWTVAYSNSKRGQTLRGQREDVAPKSLGGRDARGGGVGNAERQVTDGSTGENSRNVANAENMQRNGRSDNAAKGNGQIPQLGAGSRADDVADANNQGPQGRAQAGNLGSIGQGRNEQPQRRGDGEGPARRSKSRMGGVVDGLSRKMDGVRLNDELGSSESRTEGSKFDGESLRVLRGKEQTAAPSPRLQQGDRGNDTMSDVSCSSGSCGRDADHQANEILHPLRRDVSAYPQQEPQALQPEVSLRSWADQRFHALESPEPRERVKAGVKDRAARLKALGNAVHPDIPMMIGRAILQAEDSR